MVRGHKTTHCPPESAETPASTQDISYDQRRESSKGTWPTRPCRTGGTFEARYLEILETRFAADPKPFQELAAQARATDVYLGCSCPTTRNPDPDHCHTILALRFMKAKFPDLEVVFR